MKDPQTFSIYLYSVKGKIIYPFIDAFYSQAIQMGVKVVSICQVRTETKQTAANYPYKQECSLSCMTEIPLNLKTVLVGKFIVNSILLMSHAFQADPYLIVSLGDTKYDRRDERVPETLNPIFGR